MSTKAQPFGGSRPVLQQRAEEAWDPFREDVSDTNKPQSEDHLANGTNHNNTNPYGVHVRPLPQYGHMRSHPNGGYAHSAPAMDQWDPFPGSFGGIGEGEGGHAMPDMAWYGDAVQAESVQHHLNGVEQGHRKHRMSRRSMRKQEAEANESLPRRCATTNDMYATVTSKFYPPASQSDDDVESKSTSVPSLPYILSAPMMPSVLAASTAHHQYYNSGWPAHESGVESPALVGLEDACKELSTLTPSMQSQGGVPPMHVGENKLGGYVSNTGVGADNSRLNHHVQPFGDGPFQESAMTCGNDSEHGGDPFHDLSSAVYSGSTTRGSYPPGVAVAPYSSVSALGQQYFVQSEEDGVNGELYGRSCDESGGDSRGCFSSQQRSDPAIFATGSRPIMGPNGEGGSDDGQCHVFGTGGSGELHVVAPSYANSAPQQYYFSQTSQSHPPPYQRQQQQQNQLPSEDPGRGGAGTYAHYSAMNSEEQYSHHHLSPPNVQMNFDLFQDSDLSSALSETPQRAGDSHPSSTSSSFSRSQLHSRDPPLPSSSYYPPGSGASTGPSGVSHSVSTHPTHTASGIGGRADEVFGNVDLFGGQHNVTVAPLVPSTTPQAPLPFGDFL